MNVRTSIIHGASSRPLWSQEFAFTDCEPFCCGASRLDGRNTILHIHTGLELGYVLTGNGFLRLGEKTYPLGQGDGYFLNPIIPHYHSCEDGGDMTMLWAHLPVEAAITHAPAKGDLRLLEPFIAAGAGLDPVLPGNVRFGLLLPDICQLHTSRVGMWELRAWAELGRILVEIAERTAGLLPETTGRRGEKRWQTVARAVQFISARFAEPISLQNVAGACFLSPSRLSHVFAETLGCPPMHYRNKLRVDLAVKLLRSSDRKVDDIAVECGFSSLSQFREVFKQVTGKTPGQIRSPHAFRIPGESPASRAIYLSQQKTG